MPKCRFVSTGCALLAAAAFSFAGPLAPVLRAQPAIQANAAPSSPTASGQAHSSPNLATPTAVNHAEAPAAPAVTAVTPAPAANSTLEQKQITRQHDARTVTDPTGKKEPPGRPDMLRNLLSLVLVLGVIALAAWAFRRYVLRQKRFFTPGAVEILARTSLSPRQSLCLVKLADRLLLVGVSPNHLAALDRVEDQEEVARILGHLEKNTPQSISNSFHKLFHRESSAYDQDLPPDGVASSEVQGGSLEQLRQTRNELGQLLDKVRGLTKVRFRE